jgi:hypothetical protein
MNNYYTFKEHLNQNDLNFFEEWASDDNETRYFGIDYSLEAGQKVRLVLSLASNDFVVMGYLFNYIKVTNPNKKGYILELLNELNQSYSYPKFYMEKDGAITISIPLLCYNNFSAEGCMDILRDLGTVGNSEYEKIMKVLWS